MSISINIDWAFIAGMVGMLLTLLAYFLLQAQKLRGNGLVYQLMNAVGALGVALSLLFGQANSTSKCTAPRLESERGDLGHWR
jgi:hypothetical protein